MLITRSLSTPEKLSLIHNRALAASTYVIASQLSSACIVHWTPNMPINVPSNPYMAIRDYAKRVHDRCQYLLSYDETHFRKEIS